MQCSGMAGGVELTVLAEDEMFDRWVMSRDNV